MALKEIIPLVLLDVAIVVVAARVMGGLFRRMRRPGVVGEIIAGVVPGPSVLGLLTVALPVHPVDVAAATVGVLVDRGPGGRAAVRLAAMLGRALAIGSVDGRAGRRAAGALERSGVPVTELAAPADVDLLLVPHDAVWDEAPAGTLVLRVRPAPVDVDGDLDEILAARAAADAP